MHAAYIATQAAGLQLSRLYAGSGAGGELLLRPADSFRAVLPGVCNPLSSDSQASCLLGHHI